MGKKPKPFNGSLKKLLRIQPGTDACELDANDMPGYPGNGKSDSDERMENLTDEFSDLQERLFAAGRTDPETAPKVLLVLQGMDTAGKGGVVRHAMGLVDPQGVQLKAFKAPTKEELSHHYLWRIRKELPRPGMIGIFDRSHYEDVLIVRVNELVPESRWRARYAEINEFEAEVAASGTRIIKCFLNVSNAEQRDRLQERLDNPDKHWKYNPGDIDSRRNWDAYMAAYTDAINNCNTEAAPWYHIPADRKWYRNWAVARLVMEEIAELDLGWPKAEFDVEVERERLSKS
ncbi:MAG: phosphate--nucleotide phosphotransferase [Propionibacterium sp.]|nr:MAG: phosphate--nucleotide phosphotransferase [Propionibacterium sp.]